MQEYKGMLQCVIKHFISAECKGGGGYIEIEVLFFNTTDVDAICCMLKTQSQFYINQALLLLLINVCKPYRSLLNVCIVLFHCYVSVTNMKFMDHPHSLLVPEELKSIARKGK